MPTNDTTRNIEEIFNSESPSRSSFQTDGGAATISYVIDRDKLGESIRNILGWVRKAGDGTGKIIRGLPAAHPFYDWMYATKISDIQGISPDGRFISNQFQRQEQLFMRDFVSYAKYKMSIEFQPRPYLIATDATIFGQQEAKDWYYNLGNFTVKFLDSKEYLRFTDIDVNFKTEILSSPQGQFKFVANVGQAPHNTPISNQNGGGVNIIVGKREVKITWFFVPYEVVFGENIASGIGKVNQYDFYGYPAGSLLFEGVEVKKYPPPYPNILPNPLANGPSTEKVCDITFVFSCLQQTGNELGSGIPAINPVGRYKIPYGHNLLPWPGDLKWYYAETSAPAGAAWSPRPVYGSYPMERLFLVF